MKSYLKKWAVLCAALVGSVFQPAGRSQGFVQALGTDHLAFEAESAFELASNGIIAWAPLESDPQASGGKALAARGPSSLGAPGGIARYQLRFSTPGSYALCTRWRADSAIASAEPFGANSFSYPRTFGDSPLWTRSLANERNVPESLHYDWTEDNIQYEVTEADVATGRVFIFSIGTREEGLILDRIVLKLGKGHSHALLEATSNSPPESSVPVVQSVLGSHDLQTIFVTFDRTISAVASANFSAEGLEISQVGLDLGDQREVQVKAAGQQEGGDYILAIGGVAGSSFAPMAPLTYRFRAAQVVPGWAEARLFATEGDLSPAEVQWVDKLEHAADRHPDGGMELRSYFTPESSGRHALFTRSSAEATLTVWLAGANGFTNTVVAAPSEDFGAQAAILTPMLQAGARHELSVRIGATNGPMWLAIAARAEGDTLKPVSGAAIGALLNAELNDLRITGEPRSLTVLGSQPAQFAVQVEASPGPVYYQWQHNGEDIPGETGPVLTLPAVAGTDMGAYRAIVRAAGRTTVSSIGYLTVNPGALNISRAGSGLLVSWGGEAAGAMLESSDALGLGASWLPVMNGQRIGGAGSITVSSSGARFFRLRN